MAIDSKTKKLSLLNAILPWVTALPVASGSFDEGDKLHFLNLYAGTAETAGLPGALAPNLAYWFIKT